MSTGTVDRFQRHVPKGWSALRHSCLLSETECVVPIFAVSPLKALRILGHMAWNPGSAPGIRQSCHSWGKSRAHQWRWLVARREQPKRKAVHPCFVLPEIKLKMQNVPCCKTCMGFLGCWEYLGRMWFKPIWSLLLGVNLGSISHALRVMSASINPPRQNPKPKPKWKVPAIKI